MSKVAIIDYHFARQVCQDITFAEPNLNEFDKKVDLLWELSYGFKQSAPGWQGMMHMIYKGNEHPGQSSIRYLPMIDMYSGDHSCILSTLELFSDLASKHDLSPVVTFDQSLYWKAAQIIQSSPPDSHLRSIVLLLGCFHLIMNLLGAISTLMEGTGLKDILDYSENILIHIMTGKSVQRAFFGHLLVNKCLNKMIVSEIVDCNPEFKMLIEKCEGMYTAIHDGTMASDTIFTSEVLSQNLIGGQHGPVVSTLDL